MPLRVSTVLRTAALPWACPCRMWTLRWCSARSRRRRHRPWRPTFGLSPRSRQTVGDASFIGIDGLTLSVTSLSVDINKGGGTNNAVANTTALDFDTSPIEVNTGGGNSLTIDYATETLKAEGTVDIGVFGFFYVSGNFAFEKSSLTDVALSGGGTVASLEVLTVGASDVDAFAGVNGPADSGSAMGLSLQDVDFALVLGKVKAPAAPAVATDLRTFTAVTATVGDASFIGIDGLTLSVTSLAVDINKGGGTNNAVANTTALDFDTSPLEVNTGGGNSLTIDYATETLKAEGTVDIGVFGFFYVSGNFAFEKSSLTDVALSGGGTVASLEVLTVGASDVDAFAGVNGPADSGSAMGLSLQDVDFALVLGKVKAPAAPAVATDLRTFTAVTATVGDASFIGIDGLTLSVTSLSVDINKGGGTNNAVANTTALDFDTSPLEVNTGGGNSLTINYATETLKAEGTVDIGVFGFFYVSGNFAFEKSSLTDVALSGGGTVASLEVLTVGASDVDAFAGGQRSC